MNYVKLFASSSLEMHQGDSKISRFSGSTVGRLPLKYQDKFSGSDNSGTVI